MVQAEVLYLTRWPDSSLTWLYSAGCRNTSPHWRCLLEGIEREIERRAGGSWSPAWGDDQPERVPLECEPLRLPTRHEYDSPHALFLAVVRMLALERAFPEFQGGRTLAGLVDHLLVELAAFAIEHQEAAPGP
jgi:hypothetical protein